jgi:hypothetical protein
LSLPNIRKHEQPGSLAAKIQTLRVPDHLASLRSAGS